MATEKQAHQAREEHSDKLSKLGVHSIGIDLVDDKVKNKFAVIAYTTKEIKKLPDMLEIIVGAKTINVPLKQKQSSTFKAE